MLVAENIGRWNKRKQAIGLNMNIRIIRMIDSGNNGGAFIKERANLCHLCSADR